MTRLSLRRLIIVVCALLLAGPVGPAQAQEGFSDFFGSIFGVRPTYAPRAPVRPRLRPAHPPRSVVRARPKAKPAPHLAKPDVAPTAPGQPPAGEAAAPGFVVAVIGDTQASRLADGLDEAFADDPRIAILDKTREDSGLVRDDFYDWRKEAKALLDGAERFDMVVIQIGVNDNQKLRQDPEHQLEPLSQPFNEAYAQRVDEIAALFRDRNVPLVWVGLPIMRSPTLSNAALVFNEIAKQRATAAGARYVDLWEAFSDENSVYKASGPDVNGAIVRLRGPDGIHFNLAGARKAAHFVEPEIKRVLEAKLQPPPPPEQPETPAAAPDAAVVPAAPAEKPAPEKPLAGKIAPLNETPLSPGGALAEAPRRTAVRRDAAPPPPGRADDFSWPQPGK